VESAAGHRCDVDAQNLHALALGFEIPLGCRQPSPKTDKLRKVRICKLASTGSP